MKNGQIRFLDVGVGYSLDDLAQFLISSILYYCCEHVLICPFFRFDFGVLSTPLAWWNWYCEISPGVSGNHWHLPKTHSPWLKKILNFYSRMNPDRLSETHWQFSEIPSPRLKKILNFDFWTHPEWAKLFDSYLNSFIMGEECF